MLISVIGVILNLGSFIISLVIVPYKRMYHNIIKIIGDTILTITWSLIIYFIRFEPSHKKSVQID